MAECATVHDLTAYRRKRAAALLVRGKRGDICAHCGEPCEKRQTLYGRPREPETLMHYACFVQATGMEIAP